MAAYCMQPACHDWANKTLYPEKSVHFLRLYNFPHLFLSHITMSIAEAPCHCSTPCQHFTDPYRRGERNGGGAGMLAGGREKEEGGGEGCSGMKASATMLHRGKDDVKIRYSSYRYFQTISHIEIRQVTGTSIVGW